MSKQTEALKLALEAYLCREMPAGTIIGDPKWWVPKIAMAIREALAEQPAQQQKEGFASPGGGYVPAIPRPMPLDWKLVPRKATPEMLKAMDECAQEGYDERLYAGMASSVYMAAWDASPVMGTLPEQPAQQQEPAAWAFLNGQYAHIVWGKQRPDDEIHTIPLYTSPPPQRKPLTDEEIEKLREKTFSTGNPYCPVDSKSMRKAARAIEAKLKEKNT